MSKQPRPKFETLSNRVFFGVIALAVFVFPAGLAILFHVVSG